MILKKKRMRAMAFLLLLLSITVGYALLSQQLDINGTSKIKKTTWSIIWNNINVADGSVSGDAVIQAAEITNAAKTQVEYSINLSKPREFYEFTIDAKNEGTIDGMVNVVSNKTYESNGTTEKALPEYLTYSVTYSDGKAIAKNQLLKAGTTEKYKVRVEFKDVTADQLPSSDETIKFKFSIEYVQADENGQEVVHGLTGTRYTTNTYYTYGDESFLWIGEKPGDSVTLYETSSEAKAAFGNRPFYLKHIIESDIIKESYACFEKNDKTYCLKGQQTKEKVGDSWQCKSEFLDNETNKCIGTYFESNKAILLEAFDSSECSITSTYCSCSVTGFYTYADVNGRVTVDEMAGECIVEDNGAAYCDE